MMHTRDAAATPELRTFTGELRALENQKGSRFIEGRAVPYGVWEDIGPFDEQHEHGSMAKTIREAAKSLPLLLFHDARRFPVGKVERWKDGAEGLDAVWRMDTADDAAEAARLAGEGMLTGLSIGFVPIKSRREDHEGRMRITRTESRLLEVSLVPVPAYAGASVTLVRSRDADRMRAEAEPVEWTPSGELQHWKRVRESLNRD